MMTANIKKLPSHNLEILEDIFEDTIPLSHSHTFEPIKLSYFNFICTIASLLEEYAKSSRSSNFNIFLIDHYVHRQISNIEIHRQFHGLMKAWKKYADHHQDAKLFLSLLQDGRNNKQFIKQFLKLRKTILKNLNSKILEEMFITHGDALTISHILFEEKHRMMVSRKINELFISLKRKMINTAKYDKSQSRINGAVCCEFFLKVNEEIQIKNFPVQKLKETHKQQKKYPYNLSFSDQFLDQYDHTNEEQFDEYDDWKKEKNFEQVKNQFNILTQKDKDIDTKLENAGVLKAKRYPEGWDQFLQTNQKMKKKLLNKNTG